MRIARIKLESNKSTKTEQNNGFIKFVGVKNDKKKQFNALKKKGKNIRNLEQFFFSEIAIYLMQYFYCNGNVNVYVQLMFDKRNRSKTTIN